MRVSARTVRTWEHGGPVPWPVVLLLHLRRGDLGALDAHWRGWWLTRGRLYPPGDDRTGVSPTDVQAAPWAVQGQRAAMDELRRVRPDGCAGA